MTSPAAANPPDLGGLTGFAERLLGGAGDTLTSTRPGYADINDKDALRNWPGNLFAALDRIRPGSPDAEDEPEETIERIAEQLRSQRKLRAVVLFTPETALRRLRESVEESGKGLVNTWVAMCWTAEAAWRATDRLPEGDSELLRPLAARLRFLTLSEPMRWRGVLRSSWLGWEADLTSMSGGITSRTLGPDSWLRLAGLAQESRRAWQQCLDTYQSHPLLSQATGREIEEELAALLYRNSPPGLIGLLQGERAAPLGLSTMLLGGAAALTPEDKTFAADVVDRHLLPRFALGDVIRLGMFDDVRWKRWARRLTAGAVAGTAVAAVCCGFLLLALPAVILAAVCYGLICVGFVLFSPGWGAIWLLRMPAAAAVGFVALISLSGSWITSQPRGWAAAGTLVAVSFGYLLVLARNHGVGPGWSMLRALMVVIIGAVHAVLVSLIGLTAVGPAFAGGGNALLNVWRQSGDARPDMMLMLAAAWCLAVGVFSQILWDDRPITAPLQHLDWRK